MVQLAAQAAGAYTFNEHALRQSLEAIAKRSHASDADMERALDDGFTQGVAHANSDGIITREERLRAFRGRRAQENSAAAPDALADLDRASGDG